MGVKTLPYYTIIKHKDGFKCEIFHSSGAKWGWLCHNLLYNDWPIEKNDKLLFFFDKIVFMTKEVIRLAMNKNHPEIIEQCPS